MGQSRHISEMLPLLVGGAASAIAVFYWNRRTIEDLEAKADERRQEERRGRIRAEVKLRTLLKEKEKLESQLQTDQPKSADDYLKHPMILQCIGTVVSPFTKRMGTPRQGALVPSSRAFIQLDIQTEALDGMEDYSHLWVIFSFHANTNTSHNKKTKVRPPRADRKVGQLATRSPHRPNPLGLSLVKMERLDTKNKRLYISALDLVNGTPVYDIKPCVPWDVPGYHQSATKISAFRVPKWVDQDDIIESVQFSFQAETSLQEMVAQERLAPLYTEKNDGVAGAMATLKEILAQDPRSSHKGLKENRRGTSGNKTYALVFGKTSVEFQVLAKEGVRVENVLPIDFDEEAYVEGIPLISQLEK